MYTSNCENILFSIDENGIATLTLNRIEFLNAFTLDMYREIAAIMNYCSYADEVRVVVITGAGKHFCAGGDIKRFKRLIEAGTGLPTEGVRLTAASAASVRHCLKPVIAKINGAASGAGSALSFASDFRVVSPKSKIAAGFTKMGFSGDTGGVYYLTRIVGVARAAEFYMLGQTLSGQDAFDLGIANRLAEEGKLDEETMKLAMELVNSPTVALSYQKKMFNLVCYPDIDVMSELEQNFITRCSLTADHAEAVNAFLEKRSPKFTGK